MAVHTWENPKHRIKRATEKIGTLRIPHSDNDYTHHATPPPWPDSFALYQNPGCRLHRKNFPGQVGVFGQHTGCRVGEGSRDYSAAFLKPGEPTLRAFKKFPISQHACGGGMGWTGRTAITVPTLEITSEAFSTLLVLDSQERVQD